MTELIPPHGGVLVNRLANATERQGLLREVRELPSIAVDRREECDLNLIAIGAFSPITGFMNEADYTSVVEKMHLANGLPWTLPITLSTNEETGSALHTGSRVALTSAGAPVAILDVEEVYSYDKKLQAELVYKTTEEAHPGVRKLYSQGDLLVSGPITLLERDRSIPFTEHNLTPSQTRALIAEKGWKTVVAFQTRNPVHRAHEYLQKCALEIVDGLLLHPLVGETKDDDVPADVRMRCYEVLLERYYPANRVILSVLPASMRYAGPREAIVHALIRKNYGCTHFIIGRDHAGVGNYYGTYEAQEMFNNFSPEELGITPMKFEHAFWCNDCESMASTKTCPHGVESHVHLSGTKVRQMLSSGEMPPQEFSRPEVARILIEAYTAREPAAP